MKKQTSVVLAGILAGMFVSATLPSVAGDFAQNHPRRAQVLHRANHQNNQINARKGHLGGHYGQLKHEDSAIRHQEQHDAATNGGHITKGEQHQINKEENHVEHQINKDSH